MKVISHLEVVVLLFDLNRHRSCRRKRRRSQCHLPFELQQNQMKQIKFKSNQHSVPTIIQMQCNSYSLRLSKFSLNTPI